MDSWTEANEEGEEIEVSICFRGCVTLGWQVSALGFVHQIILGSCISLDGDGGFRCGVKQTNKQKNNEKLRFKQVICPRSRNKFLSCTITL